MPPQRSRRLDRLGTTVLLTALLGLGSMGTALADPDDRDRPDRIGRRESPASGADGREADRRYDVARRPAQETAPVGRSATSLLPPLTMPAAYPAQPRLRVYPDNQPNAADSAGLLGHEDLAPLLNGWMARSNRISTQVVGQSSQGRDLYLVTVTAPETRGRTARQTAWKQEIRRDPEAAADDRALARGYKTPIWFSANIHGNEWEGTDASMRYIERLVDAPWRQVRGLLSRHRLYFSLTLNPDGRTLGTRATALGFNENRDMITLVTPEAQSYVRTAEAVQALSASDLHGYADVLQVEPCGPPHGENYEYDLFVPHGFAIARRIEDDVVAADIPGNTYYDIANDEVVDANTGPDTAHIVIPYRDIPSGWDDYPPIFTAQYAAFYGAVTSTVELPLARPSSTTQSPENARVNVAVADQTITSTVDYVAENDDAMLADQVEVFRRGTAGEAKEQLTSATIAAVPGPDEWKQHWDAVDDQDPVTLPRAYVIPTGDTQRSATDAARLVRQLIFADVEVRTLTRAARVGGTTYPAGSYVVDMHQPLRGLANSLLDLGTDISAKVPTMYDISAWSLGYLWGATVDKVGLTTDGPIGPTRVVTAPRPTGGVPRGRGYLTFDLAGVADWQALNWLLERRVPVSSLADGSAVLGPRSARVARLVARRFGVDLDRATPAELASVRRGEARGLQDLDVGYTGTQDDTTALSELGFDDLVPLDAQAITADPSVLDDLEVLWIGDDLDFDETQTAGLAALQAWVDAGHAVVGSGTAGLAAAGSVGLVTATAVEANPDGNGIVRVETPTGSVLAPYAQDVSFIYPATAFTDLGAGTEVAQTYGAGDPLLAGHWNDLYGPGPLATGGLASAVAGEAASGARGFVFGTSVFFRAHPKGLFGEAARALFWAAPEGAGVRVR